MGRVRIRDACCDRVEIRGLHSRVERIEGGGGESSSSIEDDLALDASKAERQKRDIHECNEF